MTGFSSLDRITRRKTSTAEVPMFTGITLIALWTLLVPSHPLEEKAGQKNPLAGNPVALKAGTSLYRWYCSPCHGITAEGGIRGPDLTRPDLIHSATEKQLFQVISQGIMGTEMPPHLIPEEQIWQLITFLNDTRSKKKSRSLTGDVKVGEEIFFGKAFCVKCHMMNGRGGRLGPDLTRIGAMRSLEDLIESIRDPNASLHRRTILGQPWIGYEPVKVVMEDGRRINGVVKNEDTFTIQFMDQKEDIHSIEKSRLREIIRPTSSLMPPYQINFLSEKELEDLLTFMSHPPVSKANN